MTILDVSFPPSSNFFLPLRPTDLLALYPRTLSAYVLPFIRGTKFHTHIIHRNAKAPNSFYSLQSPSSIMVAYENVSLPKFRILSRSSRPGHMSIN